MIRIRLLLLLCVFTTKSYAQYTNQTLSSKDFIQLVRTYHPVMKQATITVKKAEAAILAIQGQFDPKLEFNLADKTLENSNYYTSQNPQLVLPTRIGADFVAGYNQLNGLRLNEDQTLGSTFYLGVSMPLLKNLIIDKRRAALQKAKQFVKMSDAEQRLMINNILFESIEAYWFWLQQYEVLAVVKENVLINKERLKLIVRAYNLGERAAIDTLEAHTQYLAFRTIEQQHIYELQAAELQLSQYLWNADGQASALPKNIAPLREWEQSETVLDTVVQYRYLVKDFNDNHPYLLMLNFKIEQLKIERKLQFQEYLPKVDLQFLSLNKQNKFVNTLEQSLRLQNNYYVGLKVEMPLLLRKGRGEYKLAQLGIDDAMLQRSRLSNEIQLKIKNYFFEYNVLNNQKLLQTENVLYFKRLLQAEQQKFLNGESSIFLVNARESKLLESQIKLIEYKTKYFKTAYAILWAAGVII